MTRPPRDPTGNLLATMEAAWSEPNGFFWKLRTGEYDPSDVPQIIEALGKLHPDDDDLLPRRFVSVIWWIPTFMEWQLERVAEAGGDVPGLKRDIVTMRNAIERILGIP